MRIPSRHLSGKSSFSKMLALLLVYCAALAIALSAQSFTTLHGFSNRSDGGDPEASLVQGADGSLYGTTKVGGLYSQGTVFKITTSGSLTTLYSFCGPHNCPDGANPTAGLVLASDGNFYGTTSAGGANSFGSVFKITPDGILTTLYSFVGTDGADPHAGLIQATDGNFYGTTLQGSEQANFRVPVNQLECSKALMSRPALTHV